MSRDSGAALCQEEELGSRSGVCGYRRSLCSGLCFGLWLEPSPHIFASGPAVDDARGGSRSLSPCQLFPLDTASPAVYLRASIECTPGIACSLALSHSSPHVAVGFAGAGGSLD